ncbi:S8 family serine peptidase [Solicola sp. PLA-1-18]|uniref:S8 family serine peptidase n=1 Tax=Solicola sp. PLA-1-18 TaxID=3380532 RepID=UPI003B7A47AC
MTRSSTLRRSIIAITAAGLLAASAASSAAADPTADSGSPKDPQAEVLSSHDIDLLTDAEDAGERQVTLLVAADRGQAKKVAAGVDRLGGTVAERFDKLGYLRVSVPTSQVRKAAAIPGVAAIDVDEVLEQPDPAVAQKGAPAAKQAATLPGPGADTPDVNPYMPTNETGATDFKTSHPTWDGRGTTIGVLDSGVDLDHPALASTSTGERKITDWVTATDPILDADGTWRRMDTTVTGPSFVIANSTWTAPAGEYRFNLFRENITAGSEPEGDVNRDGDTTDAWGVLYRASDNAIWVDTDQDLDFTDETLMRPYKEKFQVGHFGTDKPSTPIVESSPFVVEFREDVDLSPYGGANVGKVADFVNIGLVESAHGTHVAGITAAHSMFGGAMDGAAPGAKIVSSRACTWGGGCTAAALTTGMADLVVNRKVDVVNMSIGGLPALNDANNARAELYDRLISDYGVQLFISAGNSGPGLNTIGDPSVATDVVSVGASVSKDTWLSNYGSVVKAKQGMFPFSSRGPREDGGFKPNISAPGSAISTVPQWYDQADIAESGYTLPIGYAMFNGTSMASPQAAGAAALLVSAAYATDTAVTPAQLRRSLYSSAKLQKDIPTYAQGNGFFDTVGAWKLLRKGDVETRDYVVDAPVCTPLSESLKTPNRGTGVYNRCGAGEGGHKPGQAKTYAVKVTRTSGPSGSVAHRISWVGNDGTWSSSAKTVSLPLDKPVTVRVQAKPTAGAHAAIMRLDDPRTAGVDTEVLNTVVAAETPAKPAYATSWSGKVDRNGTTSYFVDVPKGTAALQLNLTGIATGSQTRMLPIDPYGVPQGSTASTQCYTNFSDTKACNPVSRSVKNPLPGVWEIEVEARRTSKSLSNPYKLKAAVQAVTVSPQTVELASVEAGSPSPVTWSLTNALAPVTVTAKGGPLGSSVEERPSIADGESATYDVVVPEGATRLDVAIGSTSDAGADLDLTVLRGTTVVGTSADGDSEEAVSITAPPAGTYTVQVDGYSVPAGTTEYDYRDVFFSPALGTVEVPATTQQLDNGEKGTVTGTVVARSAPAAGRKLLGSMTLLTTENAEVGRGDVVVGAVTQ